MACAVLNPAVTLADLFRTIEPGDAVYGTRADVPYRGVVTLADTVMKDRGRGVDTYIWHVKLDEPISLYGSMRNDIRVKLGASEYNGSSGDSIHPAGRSGVERNPSKSPADMTAGQIEKELASIREKEQPLRTRVIAAGLGHVPNSQLPRSNADVVALDVLGDRAYRLNQELKERMRLTGSTKRTKYTRNPGGKWQGSGDFQKYTFPHVGYGLFERGSKLTSSSRDYLMAQVWYQITPAGMHDKGPSETFQGLEAREKARAWIERKLDEWNTRGGKRNPASDDAAAMYETFHGAPSEQVTEYETTEYERTQFAELGDLIQLKVETTTGKLVELNAPEPGSCVETDVIKLACSPDGTSMYFIGGDQSIDVESIGFSATDMKDLMTIGLVCEVTYRTRKKFDKFEETDYYHETGEETKVDHYFDDFRRKPTLLYTPQDQTMWLAGGVYQVKDVGIVN